MKKSEFAVPPLTIDPVYADLIARRATLLDRQAEMKAERRTLEKALAGAPATGYGERVAALLGEEGGSASAQRARLSTIRVEESDLDTALTVLARRLERQKTIASAAVIAECRPEYARRVAAVVAALKTVEKARADYDDLRSDFEASDVAWTALGPLSLGFLGDRQDGHVARLVREAEAAGYA